jgi:hypothetical protein
MKREMDPLSVTEDLLKARYEFLNTATAALMTWWVSSVAFSAALISQVWSKRDRFTSVATVWWVMVLGTSLFGSIVTFGFGSVVYVNKLQEDTRGMIVSLQSGARPSLLEFVWLRFSILAGTSSFILAMLAWLALCYSILKRLTYRVQGKSAIVLSAEDAR